MKLRRKPVRTDKRGAALIIVLAFVVLLTGLVLAYFSRTVTDRQVAHSSFRQTNADQLALSATDVIVADLKQEIVDSGFSTATTVGSSTIYTPNAPANMVPVRSGTPGPGETPIPNLLRRSVQADLIPAPGVGSRASAVNSETGVSANGRSISATRWNKHYLIPKLNTTDDTIPVSSFIAPDWVSVTDQGPTVIIAPSSAVIGRYAYAIYDEGGLLDVNVAGYPYNTTIAQYGRKGSLAFADLSGLPSSIPNGPDPSLSPTPTPTATPPYQVNKIVGWRDYATVKPAGDLSNFTFDVNQASTYFGYILSNTTGFLKTSGNQWSGRTDQAFLTRQELIKFQSSTGFSANALQYLTHFSREKDANIPQWKPVTPDSTNPNFQTLLVTSTFKRYDGTTDALVGEPLVKKRFLLQRLNWLTYKGPSASRNGIANANPLEPDMALLTGTYGVSLTFLQQGTAANIVKYFGLAWDSTYERWNYNGHSGSSLQTAIKKLGTITGNREPDFFELLQAGILDASLGSSVTSDPALPIVHQQSKMLQILTIGANLIAQARTDSFPVRIACNVNVSGTPTPMEAVGMPRLPCLNSLAACAVGATQAAGGIHWVLVPNLWDPFRDTWDVTEANVPPTPAYPRPPIRIRITGSVAFGSVGASSSVKSGSVASGVTVTTFPSGSLTGIDLPRTLVTGATTNNWHGRDGFLEASRLRTNDISGAVTQYAAGGGPPTTSPTSPLAEWNSLTTTGMTQVGQGGNQRWIAFRLSLAGTNIPAGAFTPSQNPVLILKPGFQVTLDYQSPNSTWYPYSFLQGNSASTNTWIGTTSTPRNLNLVTDYSIYGKLSGTIPTLVNSSGSSTATPWATATLADAPMFAKADSRSTRYNSQIGVVNVTSPPLASASAGVVGSIWPNTYATPPPMWTTASPGPTPSPNPNPSTYSQASDNGPAGSNPYNETNGDGVRSIIMNRPFRSVGEMGYAFRDQPFKTLDFSSTNSPDAGLLDLFSVNEYNDSSGMRAGVINLNSRQAGAVAAVLKNTIRREDTARVMAGTPAAPSPAPSPITDTPANSIGTSLVSLTSAAPLVNKASLTTLIANETGLGPTVPKTQRESIARALGESDQTRTWNLMIDVIAQSGRYPPTATTAADFPKFVVEGEQRYWVHVAIDRFTGEVIDRQVEVVNE
jgi:Tfp pilus assembly protein PilX